ncbi:MAG TPA: hypothetical protein VHR66_33120 [Gemmataceae bacterium]|nr:hypothetical protein [Gemmataceae bacterium]
MIIANQPRTVARPVPQGTLSADQLTRFVREPLTQLAADWRLPVWDFWAHFAHLLPTQLPLCTQIRHWRDQDGLTLDMLRSILAAMMSAAESGRFNFASDLFTDLGRRVSFALTGAISPEAARIRRIQAQRDAAERRGQP